MSVEVGVKCIACGARCTVRMSMEEFSKEYSIEHAQKKFMCRSCRTL